MKKVLSLILATLLIAACFAVVPVSAAAWDGTTATAPTGTGTEADPYIVESAENLLWMSQQIGDGTVTMNTTSNPFKDKFFKQTKDIDLGGKTLPSIGYFYVNGQMRGTLVGGAPIKQQDETYKDADGNVTNGSGFLLDIAGNLATYQAMYVFGGTYDGQDYKISNGTVKAPGTQNFDICYGSGLFGMIYGATIQNVKLDGITAQGTSCVGVLVGRAAVDGFGKNLDGTLSTELVDVDFNQILNCSTSATCSVQSDYVTTSNAYDQAGRIGGIAGMVGGTTIRNCVNNAAINVLGNINFAGGIAGVAGQGSAINKCVNNGLITCDVTTNINKAENAYGGIVGFLAPYRTGSYATNYLGGGLSITYCYNTGSFTFVGEKNTGATYWGGILGGGNSAIANGYEYVIANCFNLCADLNGLTDDSNYRIAGLVGSYWIAANKDDGHIFITDSYSVLLAEGDARIPGGYVGLNEYISKGRVTAGGFADITTPMPDADGNWLVDTWAAADIQVLTAKIDAAIAAKAVADPDFNATDDETESSTPVEEESSTPAEEESSTPTEEESSTPAEEESSTPTEEESTTKEATTTPNTDKGDDKGDDKEGGCASVAGGIVVAILAIAAVPAVCLRKKED